MRQLMGLDADAAEYWGLAGMPFGVRPDTAGGPAPVQHAEAMARMEYLAARGVGSGVVCGARGTGKSWLLASARKAIERQTQGAACLIDAAGLHETSLIWEISAQLGLGLSPTAAPLLIWNTTADVLRGRRDVGEPLVLLLDHVDQMHESGVRTVARLLRNPELSSGIVLIWATTAPLSGVVLSELWPLTDLRIELNALDRAETSAFVVRSLDAAGATQPVFDERALDSVHSVTGGELRRIERLGRFALLAAMADGQSTISQELIEAAAAETV